MNAKAVGCTVLVYTGPTVHGGTDTFTRIEAPSGRFVTEAGTRHDEYLTPSSVHRLDRRLGLTSPFATIDPYGPNSTY